MKIKNLHKYVALLLFVFLYTINAIGQPLSGVKTVDPLGAGVNNYVSLKSAIDSLNLHGVGSGGVTFNITAGYTETAPTGGFVLTATGTQTDPIIFQKSGVGSNPILTAFTGGTGTPASAVQDGIWRLVGSDYVTIDGINLTENAANTTNPETMEYGFALFKASATNGCQHVTIQNCVITLSNINNATATAPAIEGSVGISVTNAIPTAANAVLTTTSRAGTNSYNKFYSNTIQNVNYGISLIGFAAATPFTSADTLNDIGGASIATGNIIRNFGGAASAAQPSAAIRTLAQHGLNISYNTIKNNDGLSSSQNHVSALRGILVGASTSANTNITHNEIMLQSGATTSVTTAIENASGSTAAENTVNINFNKIHKSGNTLATTGVFNGILNSGTARYLNINNNTIDSISLNGSGVHLMIETGSPGIATTNDNIVKNIQSAGSSGNIRSVKTTSPGTSWTANGNTIENISYTSTASTGSIDGLYSLNSATTITANNNIIRNLSTPSTGTLIGIREWGSAGVKTFNDNQIYNFSTTSGGTGGATMNGIHLQAGDVRVNRNKIYSLNSTGTTGGASGVINGIWIAGGTKSLVHKNKVYNLSTNSTNPVVSGILVSGNTENRISNNVIGDLNAPAASATNPIVGINLTSTATGSIIEVFFNTVRISATSSGINFGTSAISHARSATATIATLNLQNNILVNTSVAKGSGKTVVFRRSASTDLVNISTNSNRNNFYAGTPSSMNLLFHDATNLDSTLAQLKSRLGVRERNSFSENPVFASIVSSDVNYLSLTSGLLSPLESGANSILSITDDFAGNVRAGNPGYPAQTNGGGTFPDIGAFEFDGLPASPTFTTVNITPTGMSCVSVPHNLTATIIPNVGITDSVKLSYSFNNVARPVVHMAHGSGNDWTGTIPVATPGNATVRWSITAYNSAGINTTYNGASYRDEPLTGIPLAVTSDKMPLCLGDSATISVSSINNMNIGAGGTTTSGTGISPFSQNWEAARTQYLVTAAMLTSAGLTAGPIDNLAFNVTVGASTFVFSNYTMKMAHTSATALTALLNPTFTQVYGPVTLPAVTTAGLVKFNFSNNFVWDGNSNVIVEVCFQNDPTGLGGTLWSANSTVEATTTAYTSVYGHYTDDAPICGLSTGTTTSSTALPVMIFSKQNSFTSYSWSNGSTVVSTNPSFRVSPADTTTYTLTVTDANGCAVASNPLTLNVSSVSLSGNYTVGLNKDFPTITAAIKRYNEACSITGPVTFTLTDTAYKVSTGEVFPLVFARNEQVTATNFLTIRPAEGVNTIIRGKSATGLVRLTGSKYLVIDGSNNGTNSRNLTISNDTTTGAVIWITPNTTVGSNNNTIKNTIIRGVSGTTTIGGILSGNRVVLGNDSEFPNNFNTIQNNRIHSVQNAMYLRGNSDSALYDNGWLITGNSFGSTVASEKMGFRGILFGNAKNAVVSKNTIQGVSSGTASSSVMVGIQVAFSVNGGTITQNNIHDIKQNNTTAYGAYGILLANANTKSNLTVKNNFVRSALGAGSATVASNGHGIVLSTGGGYNIYHNTVLMDTNQTSTASVTSALLISNTITAKNSLDIRNNIFANKNTRGPAYAFYNGAPDSVFKEFNNNAYWTFGGTRLAFVGGADRADLTAVQTAMSGKNGQSKMVTIPFVSATDLHITAGVTTHLESGAVAIAGVVNDIDGDVRPGPAGSVNGGGSAPDLGADEFDGTPDLGDIIPPTFSLDSIVPTLNNCLTQPHTFYVKANDASGIDSVILFYKIEKRATSQVLMTLNGSGQYVGAIPYLADSNIVYSYRVVDASTNKNRINVNGGSYKDIPLVINAGPDKQINTGNSVDLSVGVNQNTILITEIIQYNLVGSVVHPPYVSATADNDFIEISNIGTLPKDISGYTLQMLGGIVGTYTVPQGVVLPGQTTLLLAVSGTTSSPANYFYSMNLTTTSSGVATGLILKDPLGNILDVVGTNSYVFAASTGVTTADWSGNIPSNSSMAGSYRVGSDDNTASNWLNSTTGSASSIGLINPGIIPASSATITWSGGLFSSPVVGGSVTTPVHPTAGVFVYTVTATAGACVVTDDVEVIVLPAVTPGPDFSADNVTPVTGGFKTTVTFSDQSLNIPETWKWSFIPNTVTYTNGTDSSSQNPKVQFNAAGVYSVKLIVSNSAGIDSLIKFDYINVGLQYCNSAATATAGEDIGKVTLFTGNIELLSNGIDFPTISNPASTGTYTDYTTSLPATDIQFGPTYTVSVYQISSASSATTAGKSVFIDYNRDGDFDDAGERVFTTTAVSGVTAPSVGTFRVPISASHGLTRMRVVLQTGTASPGPCSSFANGEVEDYAVRITPVIGDWYAPNFGAKTLNPPSGGCLAVPHDVSVVITDTTGVDSAWVDWRVGTVVQTPIHMSNVGNVYSATIPASTPGVTVTYTFRAKDNSINANVGTAVGGSYIDAIFNVKATSSQDSIGLGETVNLNGVIPPDVKVVTGLANSASSLAATPFYGAWGGNKKTFLYKASELQAANLEAGLIDALTFDVQTTGVSSYTSFTIHVDSTRDNVLTATYLAPVNQVYFAPTYVTTPGVNLFPFATPFIWNGTSNIYVSICWGNNNSGGNGSIYVKASTTDFVSTAYRHVDGQGAADICALLAGATTVSIRPDIGFNAPSGVVYTWTQSSVNGGLSSTNTINTTAAPSAIGTYVYKITANNGICAFTDSVTVKVINIVEPIAKFGASQKIGIANTSIISLTDSSQNLPYSWNWSITPNTVTYENSTTSTSRNPQVKFTNAGVYAVRLIVANNVGNDTLEQLNYIEMLPAYCVSAATNVADEDIGQVVIGNYSHGSATPLLSNPTAINLYTDYTGIAGPTAQRAVSDTISVTIVNAGTSFYSTTVNAFIDYNQNGVFDLPQERILTGFSSATSSRTIGGRFTVPVTALNGKTLLRVIAVETSGLVNNELPPCGTYTYGETEDYVITITSPPAGDHYPPTFTMLSANPSGDACAPVDHVISIDVKDSTGVDSVWLNWSVAGVVQTPMVMTHVGSLYSATIPAQAMKTVTYSFRAKDSSPQKNVSTFAGATYSDAKLKSKLKSSDDKYIGAGQSAQLLADVPSVSVIGSGNIVSSTTTPFYTWWGGNKKQYLYRASELRGGAVPAGPINGITVEAIYGTSAPLAMSAFTIYMDSTRDAVATLTYKSSVNQVFGPVTYTAPNGLNTINFTTPFVWNGSSNIYVTICWSNNNGGGAQANNTFLRSSNAGFISTTSRNIDNTAAAAVCGLTTDGSVTTSSDRPNMGFKFPIAIAYSWNQTTGGGLSATNIANPVATPTAGVGTYQYIVTANDGVCDAFDTVLVHVVPPPTVDLGPATGDICLGSTRILDAGNPGSTYKWYKDKALLSAVTTRTYTVNAAGEYKVVVTNPAGLTGSDSIVLTSAPAYTITLGPDQTICTGGTLNLSPGNVGVAYLWSNGATTQTIQVTAPGTYSVIAYNANGCEGKDTIVIGTGTAPVVSLGADVETCGSSTVTLNAGNPGLNYAWYINDVLQSVTTQTFSANATGTYRVIVSTIGGGCVATDTVVVTNKPAPVVDLGADKQVCIGTIVTLDAGNAGSTFLWSTGATTQTIQVTNIGTYSVTVTGSNGCTSTDAIVISNFASVSVNLGGNRDICTSDLITLDAGNSGSTYVWSTGATTQTIQVSLAGTYSVTVTTVNGCVGTGQVVVTNKPAPDASFTIQAETGQSIVFKAVVVGGNQYLWNFGDPSSSANTSQLAEPTHLFTAPGSYTVTLTVTNLLTGCVATTTQTIVVTSVGNDFAKVFDLYAAPNPFIGNTKIKYTLPESAQNVSIEVYDMIGRNVNTITNAEAQSSGLHEVSFYNADTENASGVYMVRLTVDGKVAIIRVVDVARR